MPLGLSWEGEVDGGGQGNASPKRHCQPASLLFSLPALATATAIATSHYQPFGHCHMEPLKPHTQPHTHNAMSHASHAKCHVLSKKCSSDVTGEAHV